MKESTKQYFLKYRSDNCKNYTLQLNKNYDSEMIEHLSKIKNKNAYFKELIQKDMKK